MPALTFLDPARKHQLLPALILIVTFGAIAFGRGALNEYAYDGTSVIERMRDAPLLAVKSVWTPGPYSDVTGVMSWRPLGLIILLLYDIQLFNSNPAASHLLNLVLHIANAILLYLVALGWAARKGLNAPRLLAATAAGLLLLHPLVSEVVLCTGFRFDLLAMLGLLFGLLVLERADCQRFVRLLTLAVLCLLLAVAGKENGVMAALVFPLYYIMQCRPPTGRTVAFTAACLIATGVYLVIWKQFQYVNYTNTYLGDNGRLLGMANFCVAAAEIYLQKLVVPYPLRIDYAFEPIVALGDWRLLRATGILTMCSVPVLLLARRYEFAVLGVAWIILGFAPVSQFTPIPDPIAERFCYIPMAGVGMLAACGVAFILEKTRTRPVFLAVPLALISLIYTALDIRRSFDWRDNLTLNIANWEQPGDTRPVALQALGALYLMRAETTRQAGETETASLYYSVAGNYLSSRMKHKPTSAESHRLTAIWHLASDQQEYAAIHLKEALRLDPSNPQIRRLARTAGLLTTGTSTIKDTE